MLTAQARDRHAQICPEQEDLVSLDVPVGTDGPWQVNARVRLGQETLGWRDDVFGLES